MTYLNIEKEVSMLGEDHSLVHEFPEYKDVISKLAKSDKVFAKDTKRYNDLDEHIRELELNDAPIEDDAMHKLKNERAELKDALYQRLVDAKKRG
jgi:uncharacterized protein YdcH (DUF465 family)